MSDNTKPHTRLLGMVQIDAPGFEPMAGELAVPVGDGAVGIDAIAIHMHELVNEIVQAIRAAGPAT